MYLLHVLVQPRLVSDLLRHDNRPFVFYLRFGRCVVEALARIEASGHQLVLQSYVGDASGYA